MTTQASYASATTGSISSSMDVMHLYYLHPSDNPGMTLTNVILSENNYSQWSRSMELALSAKLKLGFVDGTYTPPPATSNLLVHWNCCNHMVISWILNSVSSYIRNSILYMSSVRYAQRNMPKSFNLRQEISKLSQGSLSIASYFTTYKTLIDELECLTAKPTCNCNKCTYEVNIKLEAYDRANQLTWFLMGLSEQYTAIRGQILMMKQNPTISQCYDILLQ